MRKTSCLSFTGKYRKYLPSFSAASGAHICRPAHGTSLMSSATPWSVTLPPMRVHREHVVVAHGELAAKVVLRDASLEVVRGIDVDLAVEHVRRRIGGVDLGDERLRQELRRIGRGRTRRRLLGRQAGAERRDQEEGSMHHWASGE